MLIYSVLGKSFYPERKFTTLRIYQYLIYHDTMFETRDDKIVRMLDIMTPFKLWIPNLYDCSDVRSADPPIVCIATQQGWFNWSIDINDLSFGLLI